MFVLRSSSANSDTTSQLRVIREVYVIQTRERMTKTGGVIGSTSRP
jgi:hypothetical protein